MIIKPEWLVVANVAAELIKEDDVKDKRLDFMDFVMKVEQADGAEFSLDDVQELVDAGYIVDQIADFGQVVIKDTLIALSTVDDL